MEETKLQQTKFSEQVNTGVDSVGKSVEEVVTSTLESEQPSVQLEKAVEQVVEAQSDVQAQSENSASSQ